MRAWPEAEAGQALLGRRHQHLVVVQALRSRDEGEVGERGVGADGGGGEEEADGGAAGVDREGVHSRHRRVHRSHRRAEAVDQEEQRIRRSRLEAWEVVVRRNLAGAGKDFAARTSC